MNQLNRQPITWMLICSFAAFVTTCAFNGPVNAYHRDDHDIDKIVRAIDALDRAQDDLSTAANDFHGHKHTAMEKIGIAKKVLEDSRDAHVDRAVDKIQDAIDELKACVGGEHEDEHPNIHRALHALEDAKEQL